MEYHPYSSMVNSTTMLERLKAYGVGRRTLDDKLFGEDAPARLGVYDLDDENLCHEIIKTTCSVPGCAFEADSLLEYEQHYAGAHRLACAACKRALPTAHLLDLHVQETHDSFFAAMAERKPSFCCYIEECKEKFMNADERFEHCVKIHKLPKDFRFEQKQRKGKKPKIKKKENEVMDIDNPASTKDQQKFNFNNSRQKGFAKYTGRKFTDNEKKEQSEDVNMDDIASELRTNLPE